MNIEFCILINQKKDAEGRTISFCDGYSCGDPLVEAWTGTNCYPDNFSDNDVCESLFEEFNIDHPEGYRNRSLSKGDVVLIKWPHNEPRAYAVQGVGFGRVSAANINIVPQEEGMHGFRSAR